MATRSCEDGIALFQNAAWLEDGQLLRQENVDKIRHIPGEFSLLSMKNTKSVRLMERLATLVQGRYDVVCPPITAWELHKAWPESQLYFSPDAGHVATVSVL